MSIQHMHMYMYIILHVQYVLSLTRKCVWVPSRGKAKRKFFTLYDSLQVSITFNIRPTHQKEGNVPTHVHTQQLRYTCTACAGTHQDIQHGSSSTGRSTNLFEFPLLRLFPRPEERPTAATRQRINTHWAWGWRCHTTRSTVYAAGFSQCSHRSCYWVRNI